jgi:hypothetical protein
MPRPLRLTRQQIVERTTKDIRLRAEARLAQLLQGRLEREQEIVGVSDEEDWEDAKDFEDEGPPPCEVCLRRQVYWTVCVRLSCFFLFLLLLHSLNRLYNGSETKPKTM